ncbi:MAG TPA: PilW family protein [Burkholderiaceae bacterium]
MPSLAGSRRGGAAAGFTLVELLVALALSMILVGVMLKAQQSLATQTVHNADSETRDNEARTALDLINRTVTGAGFLLGGSPQACNEMFTYNSGAQSTSKYFVHHPVDAVAATSGLYLPFASGLQLTYPGTSGTPTPSDVLAVTTSSDATGFDANNAPIVAVSPNSAYTPMSTGKFPMQTTTGLTAGDTAILQVALTNRIACFRLPIASLSTASGSPDVDDSAVNALMPSTFLNGYASSLTTAGYGTMTDAAVFQGQFVDITYVPPGMPVATTPRSTSAVTVVFYVDRDANYSFPVLKMATYSFKDDSVQTAPQIVAAGVVSLQVRFGVDPGKTGAITAYHDAATVTTNNEWDTVRSTKVAIVSRSLTTESDMQGGSGNAAISSIPVCTTTPNSPVKPCLESGFGFAAVTIPSSGSQQNHRYVVSTLEIANRNALWNCNGLICKK